MQTRTMHNAPKRLAILIGSLGLLSAMPAGATIIDMLTASSSNRTGANPVMTNGPFSNSVYVSSSISGNDTVSSSVGGAWGVAGGAYGASGNGVGVFDSAGNFSRSWNITNNSGGAQAYSITFYVYRGSINALDNGNGGSGYANYSINIFQGALSLFNSAATINSSGALVTSGASLAGATHSGSNYSWAGSYITLGLGTLNPGDSTSLQYDLVGHAYGNYTVTGGCSFSGYGPSVVVVGSNCGTSNARIGDPDDPSAVPIPGIGIFAVNVPEPTTWTLLGIGVAGMLARRRRKIT